MPLTSSLERLRAEVLANPESKDAALVLADALTEAGDRHGELIALQVHELGGKAEAALRMEFEREIVGSMYDEHDESARRFDSLFTFEWQWGFVRRASTEMGGLALGHRSMQLVRELATLIDETDGTETQLSLHSLPQLRTLHVEYWNDDSATLEKIYRCQPQIEELSLVLEPLDQMWLGDVSRLRKLRRLELECDDFGAASLERLCKLKLPKLERLAIRSDIEEVGELSPLFESLPMTVTELGVFGFPETVELVSALIASPAFLRLKALGFDFDDWVWMDGEDSEYEDFFKLHRPALERLSFFCSREGKTDADCLSGLGKLLSSCLGRHAEGEEQIVAATELEPEYATHWLSLARVRAARGNTNGALVALAKVDNTDPDEDDEEEAAALRATLQPGIVSRLVGSAKRWFDD